jgi:hypothetical protein
VGATRVSCVSASSGVSTGASYAKLAARLRQCAPTPVSLFDPLNDAEAFAVEQHVLGKPTQAGEICAVRLSPIGEAPITFTLIESECCIDIEVIAYRPKCDCVHILPRYRHLLAPQGECTHALRRGLCWVGAARPTDQP